MSSFDNDDDWVVFSSSDSTASDHEDGATGAEGASSDGASASANSANSAAASSHQTSSSVSASYVLPSSPGETSVSTLSQSIGSAGSGGSGSPPVASQIQYFESLGHSASGASASAGAGDDASADASADASTPSSSANSDSDDNETAMKTTTNAPARPSIATTRCANCRSAYASKLMVVPDDDSDHETGSDHGAKQRRRRPWSRWYYLVTAYDNFMIFTLLAGAVILGVVVAATMVTMPILQHHLCPQPAPVAPGGWEKVERIFDDVIYVPAPAPASPARRVWEQMVRLGHAPASAPPAKVKRVDQWMAQLNQVSWRSVVARAQNQSVVAVNRFRRKSTRAITTTTQWLQGQWQVYRDEELPTAKATLCQIYHGQVVPLTKQLRSNVTQLLNRSQVGAHRLLHQVSHQCHQWEAHRAETRVWLTYQAHRIISGWKRRRAALVYVHARWPALEATWKQVKAETRRGLRAAVNWLQKVSNS
ncbi:hypothetical protein DIURU_000210 [Diutina rugosa]|uniref:Transmembrane protein n=1 Tax=Diutina rugosa TaxID=5481 RepID=A0A642UYU4_DIURU|nr:uncharacterized protein DIURU_000210 [Diutina rugosa]KAA8908421.1 hypothetical protein DIURU_000210 [Diutina rugosa]